MNSYRKELWFEARMRREFINMHVAPKNRPYGIGSGINHVCAFDMDHIWLLIVIWASPVFADLSFNTFALLPPLWQQCDSRRKKCVARNGYSR